MPWKRILQHSCAAAMLNERYVDHNMANSYLRSLINEPQDQILIYTKKFDDSKEDVQKLIDVIAKTKTRIVSILQDDFEQFAKHYPFLVTESKKPSPKYEFSWYFTLA